MRLTLNIIEHELEAYGCVVRTRKDNASFADFRLFVASTGATNPDVLYLCGSHCDVEKVVARGCCALYVNETDLLPDNNAVLSLLEGESIQVVFNAMLDLAFKFGTWEHSMDEVCFRDGSLQSLMDLSSPLLQNNVVILDPALKLLAYTKDIPCDDPITVELISHGYHTEENISKFKLHKRFKPWAEEEGFIINDTNEICKYTTVVRSFKTKSSFSLIIVMMCNVVEPEEYLLDIYDMFASHVEYFSQRDYPDDKPSGNAVDTFLKDLFLNAIPDERAVKERCKSLGLPYEARFCLFYIKDVEGLAFRTRLLSDVSRLVAPAKTVLVDDAVAVLCFNCRSDRCALHCSSNTCPHGHASLSSRIDDMMVRYDVECGRSSKFTKLGNAHLAFTQAKVAYEISRSRGLGSSDLGIRRNWSRITSFDSCTVDYLADLVGKEGLDLVGATYAGFVLDTMYRQDIASKTDNYAFLYEYLMNERRTTLAAEKLHMHRNNVKYRIDRIEEQFGIDTNDPDLRFDFLLAYRLREAALMRSEH